MTIVRKLNTKFIFGSVIVHRRRLAAGRISVAQSDGVPSVLDSSLFFPCRVFFFIHLLFLAHSVFFFIFYSASTGGTAQAIDSAAPSTFNYVVSSRAIQSQACVSFGTQSSDVSKAMVMIGHQTECRRRKASAIAIGRHSAAVPVPRQVRKRCNRGWLRVCLPV